MAVIPVALIQFDTVPEDVAGNLQRLESLAEAAVASGAQWVMFHELCVCDYTPKVAELAEMIPEGKCTQQMLQLAGRLDCIISFSLPEHREGRFHIAQVFVGPEGLIYTYRKTWIWHDVEEHGRSYRDEWRFYDPGTGPELFEIDGIKATCFICADGEAPRCITRAAELKPQLTFYPNNRADLPFEVFAERARFIGAPMLVTNRVGRSWVYRCTGGCIAYSASGEVIARANVDGNEEILMVPLQIPK